MPRLFTSLEIPQSQQLLLSLKQSGLDNIRWIEPADMHITLRFIGDVSPSLANDIVDQLRHQEYEAPTIRLGELKAFGNSKPRTIYASVAQDDTLDRLHEGQESLFRSLGLEAETRKYVPHVTLGRCRNCSSEDVAAYLGVFAELISEPFVPSSYALYSAKKSTGGGPYIVEERFALTTRLTNA